MANHEERPTRWFTSVFMRNFSCALAFFLMLTAFSMLQAHDPLVVGEWLLLNIVTQVIFWGGHAVTWIRDKRVIGRWERERDERQRELERD